MTVRPIGSMDETIATGRNGQGRRPFETQVRAAGSRQGLRGGQDAGLIRLAHQTTCSETESDSRHVAFISEKERLQSSNLAGGRPIYTDLHGPILLPKGVTGRNKASAASTRTQRVRPPGVRIYRHMAREP